MTKLEKRFEELEIGIDEKRNAHSFEEKNEILLYSLQDKCQLLFTLLYRLDDYLPRKAKQKIKDKLEWYLDRLEQIKKEVFNND